MLARRFLGCVFVLTLIAVIGAFAIYEFGDRALTKIATPQGHFQAPPAQDGTDYADAANWLVKPGLAQNLSLWAPDGFVAPTTIGKAAVFYVHPTTYLQTDRWNAPLVTTGEVAARTNLFVRSQASAFAGAGEVWAPRYRQAAFGAFLLKSDDATKALDLAYQDVSKAFDAFLAANPGKPIIVAGHSQGALHVARLLRERGAALKSRIVAAYVVGWPISTSADLPALTLPVCAGPDATHCLLGWQSFREPANPDLVLHDWLSEPGYAGGARKRSDMVCVDPIGGKPGGASPPAANPGTLAPDATFARATFDVGKVGARCVDGLLIVDGQLPELGPFVLPGNNYHPYDIALFWGAVRRDAERRTAAFK